jgi:aryl-alcohol dehydrogenase-like predicted oxidoreductase
MDTVFFIQSEYSLFYREEEREMNAYCAFKGIGLTPWGPLNGGQLVRPLSAKVSTLRAGSTKGLLWVVEAGRRRSYTE